MWTKVRSFVVADIPAGATVTIRCTPKGKTRKAKRSCAFKKTAKAFKAATRRSDFAKSFKKREMIPGTKIEVRVTKPGSIGKVVTYTVQKTRRVPPGKVQCLALGVTKPAACAR